MKERPFGLANGEGNHGEDLKDYFFICSTPQPIASCGGCTSTRSRNSPTSTWWRRTAAGADQPEYELVETGIFADNRYFDVFVDYAKASPEDLLIRIRVVNRGA